MCLNETPESPADRSCESKDLFSLGPHSQVSLNFPSVADDLWLPWFFLSLTLLFQLLEELYIPPPPMMDSQIILYTKVEMSSALEDNALQKRRYLAQRPH